MKEIIGGIGKEENGGARRMRSMTCWQAAALGAPGSSK